MRPRIAISIAASTPSEASRMLRKASRLGADLAEIRLDYLRKGGPIEKLVGTNEIPVIATFRSTRNGGARSVNEARRTEALVAAAKAGVSYVDVELETNKLDAVVNELHHIGAETIVSYHNFSRTPSDAELRKVLEVCRGSGARLSKLVTTARQLKDNLRLLSFTQEACMKGRIICFGMGRVGLLSRIFSPIFGSAFTFASLDDGRTVAPGQISLSRIRRIYREMGYS